MQIAFQTMSTRRATPPLASRPSTSTPESDHNSVLDKIDIEGDRVVSELHLKNAWEGAGMAVAGAAVGITGAALALTSSGSIPGLVAGGIIAGVGTAISLTGIYLSDSAFIAAANTKLGSRN